MASAGSNDIIVSVILPVRNEEGFIGRILKDLQEQTYPGENFEVLVVDGMSDDKTVAEAEHHRAVFPNFQILENPGRFSSRARNIGIKASKGKYLVFIDGHCHVTSQHMLADMVELFDETEYEILCRPQPLTMKPQNSFQMAAAAARASVIGHGLDSTIYSDRERPVTAASAGAMYRREVLESLGGFDEDFDACEDVELNFRADMADIKALISPKLTVEYAARENLRAFIKQLYRYGVGRYRLFRKHPGTLGLGAMITFLFALGVLFYPLFWLSSVEAGLLATIPALIYTAVVVGISLRLVADKPKSLLLHLPIIFFIIHFSLGVGLLTGGFVIKR